jgi:hypothetical protein
MLVANDDRRMCSSSGRTGNLLVGEEDIREHGLGLQGCLQNRQTLCRSRRTSTHNMLQTDRKNTVLLENR